MEEVEYLCRCVFCGKLCDPADFVSRSTNDLKLTRRCLKCRLYSCKVVRTIKISKMCEAQKLNKV